MIKKLEYYEENEFDTIIHTDVKFVGNIETQGPTLIKGFVENSKIQANLIVVVKDGKITGEINSDLISVFGKCEGELNIYDTLTLLKGGQIKGKIRTKDLVVSAGGVLNAECSMELPKSAENTAK